MSSEAFIDELAISVYAGDGGDGCMSFRREKFVPFGGPNGGDGGRGGNVLVVADRNLATLNEQRIRKINRAESGAPGGNSNKTGRGGADSVIHVPVGTLVYDLEWGGRRAADRRPRPPRRRLGRRRQGRARRARQLALHDADPAGARLRRARATRADSQAAPVAQDARRRRASWDFRTRASRRCCRASRVRARASPPTPSPR